MQLGPISDLLVLCISEFVRSHLLLKTFVLKHILFVAHSHSMTSAADDTMSGAEIVSGMEAATNDMQSPAEVTGAQSPPAAAESPPAAAESPPAAAQSSFQGVAPSDISDGSFQICDGPQITERLYRSHVVVVEGGSSHYRRSEPAPEQITQSQQSAAQIPAVAAVDSEPACSGSGGGSEHAGGGSEPAGGGSGGAESDPDPDHSHSEQPMPQVEVVLNFYLGENAASSVGADDTSSILTAPTATPAAAPTATPAAHASMQDQEPACSGPESPAPLPSSPTEVEVDSHTLTPTWSPSPLPEDAVMEDKPNPEEGAPSLPAGGENEPASGGSGASMQYQGPPAAAQSLRATPVETTLAFQQTGEQYEGELKLKLWDMQSTVNRLESPIAQPPGTLDNTIFPILLPLPTGP